MALLVCIPAVCSSKFIYFFKQTLIFLDVEQAVFEIGVIFVVVLATSTGFFFSSSQPFVLGAAEPRQPVVLFMRACPY